MSKTTKIWLVIATFLVVSGMTMFVMVMSKFHWDFTKLSTEKYETNIYEINEKFSNLSINTDTADILFAVSDDNSCRVVCYEQENIKHSATVRDDTLVIDVADEREWFEYIGINSNRPKMTVYLPETEYSSLFIKGSTGDIEMPKDFKFEAVDISLSTGDVKFFASAFNRIKIKTSTGDISLNNVISTGNFSIKSSTGDVKFDGCDAAEIYVKTDTGNVSGTLLTDKVFVTDTDTGSVDVPKTVTGGKCEINTNTGDITMKIE